MLYNTREDLIDPLFRVSVTQDRYPVIHIQVLLEYAPHLHCRPSGGHL